MSTYPCLREIVSGKIAIHLISITLHVGVSGFLNFNNKSMSLECLHVFFFQDNRYWTVQKDMNDRGCEPDVAERI